MADGDYAFIFEFTLKTYKATFYYEYFGEWLVLSKQSVIGGEYAAAPNTTPSKYCADFIGWTTEPSLPIVADTDFYPVFRDYYLVEYHADVDNRIFATQKMYQGDTLELPMPPVYDRYYFSHWDYSAFDANCTWGTGSVFAVYEKVSFLVTFLDIDGGILSIKELTDGAHLSISFVPPVTCPLGFVYKWVDESGAAVTDFWDILVTRDMSFRVVTERAVYTVKFVDSSGTIVDTQYVYYGEKAVRPAIATVNGKAISNWYASILSQYPDYLYNIMFEPCLVGNFAIHDDVVFCPLFMVEVRLVGLVYNYARQEHDEIVLYTFSVGYLKTIFDCYPDFSTSWFTVPAHYHLGDWDMYVQLFTEQKWTKDFDIPLLLVGDPNYWTVKVNTYYFDPRDPKPTYNLSDRKLLSSRMITVGEYLDYWLPTALWENGGDYYYKSLGASLTPVLSKVKFDYAGTLYKYLPVELAGAGEIDMYVVAGIRTYTVNFYGKQKNLIRSVEVPYGTYFPEFPATSLYYDGCDFLGWGGSGGSFWYYENYNGEIESHFGNASPATDWAAKTVKDDINLYQKYSYEIKVSYYTIERLYYTKQNKFLWIIPTGTSYKYMDVLVYRTDTFKVLYGAEPDLDEMLGTALYDVTRYKNVSGFEFKEWVRNGNHYTAEYDIPKVAVNYYGSNGKFVETRYIDLKFVPIVEVTFNWLDGFEKYFDDILVKWSLAETVDDIHARDMAKEAVKYLSERYKQGKYEIYFMTAQPDVKVDLAYGLFKSSGAAVESGTFHWLQGTDRLNNFVYFADFSDLYVTGLHYDLRVTFDTPYDVVWNGVKGGLKFFTGWGIWKLLLVIAAVFVLILVIVKVAKK
jgi:hypothetical protein